jgi:hypothetical protein
MNTPVVLGSFFATALLYRNGHVTEAPAVVQENLHVRDLLDLQGSRVHAPAALDQFRAEQVPAGRSGKIEDTIDPATFYAGRVCRSFSGNPANSHTADVTSQIDHNKKVIATITGELHLDYGTGVATIDTPQSQGAAGFLSTKGTVKLSNVDIAMRNNYGTVLVVALDDRPLAVSRKILIQCMTVDQLYGWQTSNPDNFSGTIQAVGSAPFSVEKIDATITLRLQGRPPRRGIACDENGYPTDKHTKVTATATATTVQIDESTPYTVVLR